jgi:hypothetical protein
MSAWGKAATDTNGILDRCCRCRERARFVKDDSGYDRWKAECTECAETTEWVMGQTRAMVVWNRSMRSNASNQASNEVR